MLTLGSLLAPAAREPAPLDSATGPAPSASQNDVGAAVPINLIGVAGQSFDVQTALAWTRGEGQSTGGGGIPGIAGPSAVRNSVGGASAAVFGGDLGKGVEAASGALGIWDQGAQGGPLSGTLGGAVSGAEIGTAIGGPAGTVLGAIGGGILGLLGGIFGGSSTPDDQSTVYSAPSGFNMNAYAYMLGQKQPNTLTAAHSYTAQQDLGTLAPSIAGSALVQHTVNLTLNMADGTQINQTLSAAATSNAAANLNMNVPE
jgi:hypothetical protein